MLEFAVKCIMIIVTSFALLVFTLGYKIMTDEEFASKYRKESE